MACIHGSKLDDYREWGGGSRFEPPNEAKEGFDRKRINVSWESTTRLDSLSLSPSLIALEIGLVGGEGVRLAGTTILSQLTRVQFIASIDHAI